MRLASSALGTPFEVAAFRRGQRQRDESDDMARYLMTMKRENNSIKCKHENAETLGSNNTMQFLRCLTCRSVIVTQGSVSLAIPPARAAA